MLISPLLAYGKHVDHALNGRTRDTEGLFVSMEEECVGRDGVEFYPMTINVGDKNAEKDMPVIAELINTVLESCSAHVDALSLKKADVPTPEQAAGLKEHAKVLASVAEKVHALTADKPLNRY